MIKRFLSVALATTLVVLMFTFNISAAGTSIVSIDPSVDIDGDVFTVICTHAAPENMHTEGGASGIGWTKTGDIANFTVPVDFGDGLVSLKVNIAAPNALTDAKLIVKAGTTVIAEVVPVVTTAWEEYVEVTATLKDSIKGSQTVSIEWVNGGFNVWNMDFEVKTVAGAVSTAASTNAPAKTSVATSAVSTTAKTVVATTKPSTASATTAPAKTDKKSSAGLIIAIVAGVVVVAGGAAYIIIKKKK